jgi:small multidrug resistance family-3 protein
MLVRSIFLFGAAAVAEIGGAFLMWRGVREGAGPAAVILGAAALVAYGLLATMQPSSHFGRVLAAYGGVFVIGSLAWGIGLDGFRPDRFDILGAATCVIGASIIIWAPHSAS